MAIAQSAPVKQRIRLVELPVSFLKPYERNPRRNDDAVEAVAKSIDAFGFNAPIICDEDYRVCVGHTRLKAAMKRGVETVPVLIVSDLTGDKFRGYNIADNQTGTIAEWDDPVLWAELQELEKAGISADLLGFGEQELRRILAKAGIGTQDEDTDAPGPLLENPITQVGDLWFLGPQRLLCGDASSRPVVNRLLDSQVIDFAFTSPPYNVGVEYASHNDSTVPWAEYKPFLMAVLSSFLPSLGSGRFIGWNIGTSPKTHHAHQHAMLQDECGLTYYRTMIWKKVGVPVPLWFNTAKNPVARHFTPNYTHEIVLLFSKGKPQLGEPIEIDDLCENDVFEYGQQFATTDIPAGPTRTGAQSNLDRRAMKAHPAAFPVRLPQMFMTHLSDRGAIVFDPFVGSESTIIAAERLGRRCFAMDIDPGYCDVAVKRWEKATGKSAERIPASS